MKANQLTFQNLIDINPRTGIIKLGTRRMALISADALGILRRDLVNVLGMERAKGFLMRYGWAKGYHDGRVIEMMFDWSSKRELFLAGPAIHTLEGIVTVEADVLEFDDENLYYSGFWMNSYEADEHIHHFGHSDEAVCWTLIGYASGYLTRTFGKDVLVKERQCRGKQDEYCYFVARTVNVNDPEYAEEFRYYQTESLTSELDRIHHQLKELNRMILEAQKFHEYLLDIVLDGQSLSYIVKVIAEVIGRSVIIEKGGVNHVYHALFQTEAHKVYYSRKRDMKDLRLERDVFDLRARHTSLGRMVIIGESPLTQQQQLYVERAVSVCTIQMFHQRSIAESVWKMKGNFFEDLIRGQYDNDLLESRADSLDIQLEHISRIVVLRVDPPDEIEQVLTMIDVMFPRLDTFIKQSYAVIILPQDLEKRFEGAKQLLKHLKQYLEENCDLNRILISSGRLVHTINQLGESYQDALRIIEFLQQVYPSGHVVGTFEQLEPIMLFIKGTDHRELIRFYQDSLKLLIQHDDAQLIYTLKTFLDHNGNLQQTANQLHLSVTGLRYRLQRIEEITGADLKDGAERFKYQLALLIYYTLQIDESDNRDEQHK